MSQNFSLPAEVPNPAGLEDFNGLDIRGTTSILNPEQGPGDCSENGVDLVTNRPPNISILQCLYEDGDYLDDKDLPLEDYLSETLQNSHPSTPSNRRNYSESVLSIISTSGGKENDISNVGSRCQDEFCGENGTLCQDTANEYTPTNDPQAFDLDSDRVQYEIVCSYLEMNPHQLYRYLVSHSKHLEDFLDHQQTFLHSYLDRRNYRENQSLPTGTPTLRVPKTKRQVSPNSQGGKSGFLHPAEVPRSSKDETQREGLWWRDFEEEACIRHMLNIRDENRIKGEERFREAARRMQEMDAITRSWTAVKNFWNRKGRARSGFDERRKQKNPLATSQQGKKGEKRKAEHGPERQPKWPRVNTDVSSKRLGEGSSLFSESIPHGHAPGLGESRMTLRDVVDGEPFWPGDAFPNGPIDFWCRL